MQIHARRFDSARHLHPSSLLAAALLAAACVPTTAAYLSVPVESPDGDLPDTVVRIPLAELAARMPDFDAARVAFYHEGRTPLPHRLVDDDGDGRPDVAVTSLPVRGDGATRLIAVCPGPTAPPGGDELEAEAGPAVLRFDLARR